MRRGVLPCVVTLPKVALVMLLVAPPQRTRFRTLNASPRTSKDFRSANLNVRPRATFSLKFHGVRSLGLLRVALPNTESSVACEMPWLNAFLSYHTSLFGSNFSPAVGARHPSYEVMKTRLPVPMGLAPEATVSGVPDS